MAEAFPPFPIQRTIGNLTFYLMEGRNFVRKKSSLTRRKVLYSPAFERTRHNASLMGRASKIGSFLFNSLPAHWRQSWMYRSFTGEAYTLLKKGKEEREIRQFLYDRYIQEVVNKQTKAQPVVTETNTTKRAYIKKDTTYWETKTQKSIQRKVRKQQRQLYSNRLADASKMASELYQEIPVEERNRSHFQQLTAWAMQFLKKQEEADAVTELPTHQPNYRKISYINSKKGKRYFIPSLNVSNCKYFAIRSAFEAITLPSGAYPISILKRLSQPASINSCFTRSLPPISE
jgi:hypothetical protein